MKHLLQEIDRVKRDRNAIILAHVYQRAEVQDVADFTGDSLDLSRKATETAADVIVFCGVRFMAETATIMNPGKIVLLPEHAGCALADMATREQARVKKKKYPQAAVVSYINSPAAVKAESDVCCTSANAINVMNSLAAEQVLFLPDRNLGRYVASCTNAQTKKLFYGKVIVTCMKRTFPRLKLSSLRKNTPKQKS